MALGLRRRALRDAGSCCSRRSLEPAGWCRRLRACVAVPALASRSLPLCRRPCPCVAVPALARAEPVLSRPRLWFWCPRPAPLVSARSGLRGDLGACGSPCGAAARVCAVVPRPGARLGLLRVPPARCAHGDVAAVAIARDRSGLLPSPALRAVADRLPRGRMGFPVRLRAFVPGPVSHSWTRDHVSRSRFGCHSAFAGPFSVHASTAAAREIRVPGAPTRRSVSRGPARCPMDAVENRQRSVRSGFGSPRLRWRGAPRSGLARSRRGPSRRNPDWRRFAGRMCSAPPIEFSLSGRVSPRPQVGLGLTGALLGGCRWVLLTGRV